ncbi:GTP-binding protein [Lewinella marina]|uniref:GTPase Obg n=1 Tax=Neolewinella marina TaxID=438751 RepID=A0A2G0CJR3_9BACT|nr:GTPase ObgE [Neolewinella marina]NJB84618.1 GTP-binding protein [Neolewinella marina]PHL00206.1 GTPase ObgE [Neolewinella marina]
MAKANFVDYVKINLTSGDGGAGSRHFYRAKGIPKGGPDGGDGGRGGHIILKGNRNLWTLLQFKYKKHIRAEHGQRGSENNKTGATGADVVLEVPLGTIARDAETNEFLFEITRHDEEYILLEGGRGGLGNSHFKSSTNQSPEYAQPGEPGIEGWYILELKVLADVGLVGLPNVGKSTLLSVVTAAKPEIANYAFTTLVPNIGMVQYRDGKSFAMADIPGIIKGAHEGKGLGHRFLRHIERNATLLFCIPADADDIRGQYRILLNELENYNPELLDKPRVLALTRADMVDEELKRLRAHEVPQDLPHLYISAITGEGITQLKDLLYTMIIERREDQDGVQLSMEEE